MAVLMAGAMFVGLAKAGPWPVTVTVAAQANGFRIPEDFAGLSFETGNEILNRNRVHGYLFSPTNRQVITLFQNIGIHNLRLGGGTVDGTNAAVPTEAGIDGVFRFAKAAGNLRVIYSFRLLNGDAAADAAAAKYIWQNYRERVEAFSIGNEPDWKSYAYPPYGTGSDPAITNYASYLARWRQFASAITNAAPGAVFAGPDTGEYSAVTYFDGKSWTEHFAEDEGSSGLVALLLQHYYAGGGPGRTRGPQAVRKMLSAGWVETNYPWLYEHNLAPVVAKGMAYRMTEANDYLRGIADASNAYASALWALDFMHWWAEHFCAGVNFHNKSWLLTDTVFLDGAGNFQANPKAYGIKAFNLGAQGRVQTVSVGNSGGLNLTAYAVDAPGNLCVTIVNKENGPEARDAAVTILPGGLKNGSVSGIFLTAPGGNIAATNGLTIGGAALGNDRPWPGEWADLGALTNGRCVVTVRAASAAVVRIR